MDDQFLLDMTKALALDEEEGANKTLLQHAAAGPGLFNTAPGVSERSAASAGLIQALSRPYFSCFTLIDAHEQMLHEQSLAASDEGVGVSVGGDMPSFLRERVEFMTKLCTATGSAHRP